VWTVEHKSRQKSVAKTLKLPEAAMSILRQRKRVDGNPPVFACRTGNKSFVGFPGSKVQLDKRLAKEGTPIVECEPHGTPKRATDGNLLFDWVLHDLRRTARTLPGRRRLKVDYAVAKFVLGHRLGTRVAGTYNRSPDDPEMIKDMGLALEASAGGGSHLDPRTHQMPREDFESPKFPLKIKSDNF
jgi:hypothetical protein